METIQILALALVATLIYAVAHDLVTARVCAEYFSIGHPPLHDPLSQTMLRTGMTSVWFFGPILGAPLAWFARSGSRNPMPAKDLVPAVSAVLGKMALVSLLAGGAGYLLVEQGSVQLAEPWASRIAADRHSAFVAATWAQRAACVSGVIGAVLVWTWTWYRRGRLTAVVR